MFIKLTNRYQYFATFSGLVIAGMVVAICISGCIRESTAKTPNIVLITADDLGLQLNCYGDSIVSTPNIDALADDGILFTNAYVTQASCSPSRSTIFTGLYPHENGQLGLSHRGEFAMVPGLMTLPKMCKEQGYQTGVVGKVHVRPADDFPFDYDTNDGFPAPETKDVIRVKDSVVSFLDRYGQDPFFLMVNYFDPHKPYRNEQVNGLPESPLNTEDVKSFSFLGMSSEQIMEDVAGYYNCVKRLDTGIGMLMDELRSRNLLENTLIIFLGDHGPPFPRAKVSSYEAGLAIPMIMVWPGFIEPGDLFDGFVSTIDLFPTIAGAIGWEADMPGEGYSLVGPSADYPAADREYLFAEYNAHQSLSFHPQRTVRYKNYKLIQTLVEDRIFVGDKQPPSKLREYLGTESGSREMKEIFDIYIKPPPIQLYDLSSDPDERINLAGDPDYEDIIEKLHAELQDWRVRTSDPFLDEKILSDMIREQDSLESAGVNRVHEDAYDYMRNN